MNIVLASERVVMKESNSDAVFTHKRNSKQSEANAQSRKVSTDLLIKAVWVFPQVKDPIHPDIL